MNELLPLITELQKHIGIINDELGEIKINIAVLQTQVADLIWYFRAVISALIVLLVSQGWQILTMRKNSRNNKAK